MRQILAGLAALLLLNGCGGNRDAPPAESGGSAEALEALKASPCDLGASTGIADSTVAQFLTGSSRLNPEVYDCQRLVMTTGSSGEFGPLVGLYPVDASLRLARADFAAARPAVAIYSWGAAGGPYADTYADFAPEAGVHCLWLRNAGDVSTGWRAGIAGGSGCGDGAAPPDSAFTLPVLEDVYDGTVPADYPRTARWEWDIRAGKQLVGLKCGNAWCRVGGRNGGEASTQPLLGGNDAPREKVPGWSDAQHLSVYDSAAGKARPGPWGSVVAYPGIAAAEPPWMEGLLSARITVYGAPGPFLERFYLQPDGSSAHDDMILRFPGMQDEAWLQQGPMRRRKASRVRFTPTPDHAVVGVVRWRWQEKEVAIWSYCPSGTCAIEP